MEAIQLTKLGIFYVKFITDSKLISGALKILGIWTRSIVCWKLDIQGYPSIHGLPKLKLIYQSKRS